MRDLDAWFSHIQAIHQKRIDLGLERVGQVGEKLGVTGFDCPVITIAGTNGKGSTAKTLSSIYTAAGYCTGLYTSPHLIDFHERICLSEKMIDNARLLAAFSEVEKARGSIILSFFEFITLAALLIFKQANCDILILEVGLGGRLDAVNIVDNDVAILTSVAMDHMDYLGDTRSKIAYEKASIARRGKPFICAEQDPPEAVKETVKARGSIYYEVVQDFDYADSRYPVPRLKRENVAAAVFAVQLLQSRLSVAEEVICQGITETQWPGRFELVSTPFSCVLDVAHNPASAHFLAQQYAGLPKAKTTAIVGMLKDKQQIETVVALLPYVDDWWICDLSAAEPLRGADGALIHAFLQSKHCATRRFSCVAEAMATLDCKGREERALIFGSFYTVMAAKQWLGHGEN